MKHTFTKEVGPMTFCGDHYCTGHKIVQWVCSCGEKLPFYTYPDEDRNDTVKMKHILKEEGLME